MSQIRIKDFLNRHNVMSNNQHGFHDKRSTVTGTYDLLQLVYQAIDNNDHVLVLFYDLSRAFDYVNIELLVNKLENYGILNTLLEWIKSFLTNRKISVRINGQTSAPCAQTIGVPQGSVLSPLLFILFVNDLDKHIHDTQIVMFADDTTMGISAKTEEDLELKANPTLQQFYDWCKSNRLIINIEKTKFIVFHKRKKVGSIKLHSNNIPVTKTNSHKFLGL